MGFNMASAKISAGVCNFTTDVQVESEDLQTAVIRIATDCPSLKPLESQPLEVDGFVECFGKVGQGEIYDWCRTSCRHAACPVPAGIVKAVEVACELALPRTVTIELSK
jgi:hypothetical protein